MCYSSAINRADLMLVLPRDQWKKEKRQRLAAARESALSNEQAMIESRYSRGSYCINHFCPHLSAGDERVQVENATMPTTPGSTSLQALIQSLERMRKEYPLSPLCSEGHWLLFSGWRREWLESLWPHSFCPRPSLVKQATIGVQVEVASFFYSSSPSWSRLWQDSR